MLLILVIYRPYRRGVVDYFLRAFNYDNKGLNVIIECETKKVRNDDYYLSLWNLCPCCKMLL